MLFQRTLRRGYVGYVVQEISRDVDATRSYDYKGIYNPRDMPRNFCRRDRYRKFTLAHGRFNHASASASSSQRSFCAEFFFAALLRKGHRTCVGTREQHNCSTTVEQREGGRGGRGLRTLAANPDAAKECRKMARANFPATMDRKRRTRAHCARVLPCIDTISSTYTPV